LILTIEYPGVFVAEQAGGQLGGRLYKSDMTVITIGTSTLALDRQMFENLYHAMHETKLRMVNGTYGKEG